MEFLDRFELLESLGEDEVQTVRARERSTGGVVEAHFAASADLLSGIQAAIDRGTYAGKFYVVTAGLAEPSLNSAGAWRVTSAPAPATHAAGEAPPGDFTRMFQLRQAPEPVALASKPAQRKPGAMPQPGAFTRAFQRPAAVPSAPLTSSAESGQPGEFTRMFQQPAAPAAPVEPPAKPARVSTRLIVVTVVFILAIAVFVLVRTLY